MQGISPADETRYGPAIAVMKEMGWGWREFLEAPPDLAEEILVRMGCREKWTEERRKLDEAMGRPR